MKILASDIKVCMRGRDIYEHVEADIVSIIKTRYNVIIKYGRRLPSGNWIYLFNKSDNGYQSEFIESKYMRGMFDNFIMLYGDIWFAQYNILEDHKI